LINILNFNGRLVLTEIDEHFLPLMGENLRKLRKKRYSSDDQKTFAFRIGVSKGTYVKMEKGDLSVSMASYIDAAKLLNVIDGFQGLFVQEVDLFEELGM
jgi:DNA-binding XRE family transcriptional regulator